MLTLVACHEPSQAPLNVVFPPKTQTPDLASPLSPVPRPFSPWQVSTEHNHLTGQKTFVAVNGVGVRSIIVRKVGKRVDCVVNTTEFLGTLENMQTRRSVVKYKFDDGKVVRQAWLLSDDNTSLVYPGDPKRFLRKMETAKEFTIEISPFGKSPQTESFETAPMPNELIAIIDDQKTASLY